MFTYIFTEDRVNKLECFSLTSFSNLVWSLRVSLDLTKVEFPSCVPLMGRLLFPLIRPGWESLPRADTLAYLPGAPVKEEKSLIRLTLYVTVIIKVCFVTKDWANKLECFPLLNIYSLV